MMMRISESLGLLVFVLLVSGCASNGDYYKAITRQVDQDAAVRIAQAGAEGERWKSERARWEAMAAIGQAGDTTAKVAAVMGLSRAVESAPAIAVQVPPRAPIAPPESFGDTAFKWAAMLLPITSQMFAARQATVAAVTQSNNARDVAIAQSGATASMVGTGFQTVGNTVGTLAGGWERSVTSGFGAAQNIATHGFDAFAAARPNQTIMLSGQGVIGSGSYVGPVTTITTTTNTTTTNRNCSGSGGTGTSSGTQGVPATGGGVSLNC